MGLFKLKGRKATALLLARMHPSRAILTNVSSTFSDVIDCRRIGDLTPTQSRGDGGQNRLYDMGIVGNA